MKKLLPVILVICSLLGGNAYAEFFEINNCAYTAVDNNSFYDPSIDKVVSHQQFKYTSEYFDKLNTAVKISKKKFRENYKKWGWDKKKSDDWYKHYDPTRDPSSVWILSGTNITSKEKDKPGITEYDPWKERLEGDYDYIWIDYILTLDEDSINKFKSIGAEFITNHVKDIWSIDTDKGIVTNLWILSDEYFNHRKLKRSFEIINQKDESLKEILRKIAVEKVNTKKFSIDSYAGAILIGKKIDTTFDEKLVIDFNDMSIALSYNINGTEKMSARYKCPINTNDDDNTDTARGSSGTAFFVSNRGHLLTNNHVVEGCSISKITYKNNDYDTKLIATDKSLDLALLKAELRPKSFFNFSKNEVKKLNKVYVAGYPLGKGLSDDLKISSGIVSSLKGFQDNSNEIQIDAPINPGNSGGPIINENGDLIAIAVSGLAKDQTEGINFGIKSSAAELFLRSNKVTPKKAMYSGIKDNDKLLEILEQGTVYTYCD